MLYSAPASRSCSEWLDRLQSTRGIPVSDADLDRFLLSTPPTDESPNPDPSSAPPSVPDAPVAADSRPQSRGMCEIMTSILSDLFDMGGAERDPVLEIKRSSRKQLNPRYLPCYQDRIEASSLDSRWDERGKEGLEENVGVNEVEEEKEGCVGDGLGEGEEEEEEGMAGYSRSEVTVIDTSCKVWKFEKVVYRRKDVWKVRDRKGKGKMRKTKKRKLGGSEGDGRGAKRKLVELSGVGLKLVEDASKDEARSSFFESPMRRRNGGSPVALTRVMPTVTIKKTKLHVKSPKHCIAKQNQRRVDFNPSILWKLLSTLFTALLAVILLAWLVLRPSKPSFSLKQASVYRLSLSDSSLAASLLNSSIQLTLRVSNPNAHLGIYYDELRVYASCEGQQITNQISFPPFYQGHRDNNLLSASLDGNNLPVAPDFGSEVAHNQVTGKLKVEFAADGRIRWKVGTWVSGRYRLNVKCVTVMDFGPGLPTGPLNSRQSSQCSTVL